MTENANSTNNRITNVFVASAIAILVITSLLKLFTIIEGRPFLITPAPIFLELSWRELLSLAAIVETGTAILAWWYRRSRGALWIILWLTAIFGIFRAMLLYVRYHGPCGCLGGGAKWLPCSSETENVISLLMLAYLFMGCTTLLFLSGRGGFPRVAPLLPLFIISTTSSAWSAPQGFLISGEQVVFAEYKGLEQKVQTTTFEAASSGADWRMSITYPLVNNVDSYALVSGVPYMTTRGTVNLTNIGGGVVGRTSHMLEAMTEAARVVVFTFLNTKAIAAALGPTNSQLAPFVPPRFPTIHSYTSDIQRSGEYPFLPANITWTFDLARFNQMAEGDIQYYFKSVRPGRKILSNYPETQREPATFTASSFTNLNGLHIPLRGKLVHHYFDNDGKSGRRRFELSVHTVAPPEETDLKPRLYPGNRVTHVVDGQTYVYFTSNGTWLAANEAKETGLLRKAAPPPPGTPTAKTLGAGRMLVVICLFVAPACIVFLVHKKQKRNKT